MGTSTTSWGSSSSAKVGSMKNRRMSHRLPQLSLQGCIDSRSQSGPESTLLSASSTDLVSREQIRQAVGPSFPLHLLPDQSHACNEYATSPRGLSWARSGFGLVALSHWLCPR